MILTLNNKLHISDAPEEIKNNIRHSLSFPNPKWLENDRMGRWNGDTPEKLKFYAETDKSIIAPRGFIRQAIDMAIRHGVGWELNDQRREIAPVDFEFKGKLKPFQGNAVSDMLKKDFGVLVSSTGSGKTVMGLYLIAQRQQPALVAVHTSQLLNQWIDRIETFLDIPRDEIGVIGGGKKKIGSRVTVALVQSLYKQADAISEHIGHLVIDECHRAPSRTFTEAVKAFDCKYMLGLSATPYRRDKLSKLIFWHLGDVHHTVDPSALVENGDILQAEIITRNTDFQPYYDPVNEYSKMLSELTFDEKRNALIAKDVAKVATKGKGIALVLSDRKKHCEALKDILNNRFDIEAETLTGDVSNSDRQAVVERLNTGKVKVLVATGQLIGEGFDCRGLSTLFLSTPVKFSGRVIQYIGRVLRPAHGKDKATVYDYIDSKVGVLAASAKARQRAYKTV